MSFADKIWKEAMELQKFAASQFRISFNEAAEWVSETGIECIEKQHLYDPKKVSTLKAWVKTIMLNKYRDDYRRTKNYFYILHKEKSNLRKPIKIDDDALMTLDNDRTILKISTKTPHKASIGDRFRLQNVQGIDSKYLKNIDTVIDVIDEKTIHTTIINPDLVYFKSGGSNATIEILNFQIEERKLQLVEVDDYFEKQNQSFIQDAFNSCRKKLSKRQNEILDLRFNEVACVKCGDVHMAVKKNNKFECKNCGHLYSSPEKDTKIMSARLIAEKLREKPKTLSDHLTKALKQLGECLKLKGLGLPEKMKRDEQNV